MPEAFSGKCMCGGVTFKAEISAKEASVCHCTMCQKWAGGVSFLVEADALEVEDTDALGIFQSSDWGERGFCRQCGSSLFWRMQDKSHANVALAALEDTKGFAFTREIYVDEKPDCYSFAQETKKLTGAETIAMFIEGQAN